MNPPPPFTLHATNTLYPPPERKPVHRFVRTLDFSAFRTQGLKRSVGEGLIARFVTPSRLLALIASVRDTLTVFGASETMDSALTLPVLEALLLRPSTTTAPDNTSPCETNSDEISSWHPSSGGAYVVPSHDPYRGAAWDPFETEDDVFALPPPSVPSSRWSAAPSRTPRAAAARSTSRHSTFNTSSPLSMSTSAPTSISSMPSLSPSPPRDTYHHYQLSGAPSDSRRLPQHLHSQRTKDHGPACTSTPPPSNYSSKPTSIMASTQHSMSTSSLVTTGSNVACGGSSALRLTPPQVAQQQAPSHPRSQSRGRTVHRRPGSLRGVSLESVSRRRSNSLTVRADLQDPNPPLEDKPLEALDLCGCVSHVFQASLAQFVQRYLTPPTGPVANRAPTGGQGPMTLASTSGEAESMERRGRTRTRTWRWPERWPGILPDAVTEESGEESDARNLGPAASPTSPVSPLDPISPAQWWARAHREREAHGTQQQRWQENDGDVAHGAYSGDFTGLSLSSTDPNARHTARSPRRLHAPEEMAVRATESEVVSDASAGAGSGSGFGPGSRDPWSLAPTFRRGRTLDHSDDWGVGSAPQPSTLIQLRTRTPRTARTAAAAGPVAGDATVASPYAGQELRDLHDLHEFHGRPRGSPDSYDSPVSPPRSASRSNSGRGYSSLSRGRSRQRHSSRSWSRHRGIRAESWQQMQFPSVRRLGLAGVRTSTPDVLNKFVLSFPFLTHLDLSNTLVTDGLLRALASSHLSSLSDNYTTSSSSNLSRSPDRRNCSEQAWATSKTVAGGGTLQALSLAECKHVSSEAIVELLLSPACTNLTQLSLRRTSDDPALLREDLVRVLSKASFLQAGGMNYLDLGGCSMDDSALWLLPAQAGLLDLGLGRNPLLSLPCLAEWIAQRAQRVQVLDLSWSCDHAPQGLVTANKLYTYLLSPLAEPPQPSLAEQLAQLRHEQCSARSQGGSGGGGRNSKPGTGTEAAPNASAGGGKRAPTDLHVVELSPAVLHTIGGGIGSWRIVEGAGDRAWAVDVTAASAWSGNERREGLEGREEHEEREEREGCEGRDDEPRSGPACRGIAFEPGASSANPSEAEGQGKHPSPLYDEVRHLDVESEPRKASTTQKESPQKENPRVEHVPRVSHVLRNLDASHPRVRAMCDLAQSQFNAVSVGWHSHKMELVRSGLGFLGREEGSYAHVAYARR